MRNDGSDTLTLFLCGDVMTGRGIDQILPHSCPPHIFEQVMTSARGYVALAEEVNGPIPRRVDYGYIWGEALPVLERVRPDARIINLETSVTLSEDAFPKGINYRMHPRNLRILEAAEIDCCVLANNHVLDWGRTGLLETVDALAGVRVPGPGAGRNLSAARAPAVIDRGRNGRVLVFGMGATDSGIPPSWAATADRSGVHLLPDFSTDAAEAIGREVESLKRDGDVAVASIHWGSNWGYRIPREHRRFAHALIDRASIDVVHGHSSHHPRAMEVYRDRPIFYGCGDFINDYEGITGYEEFRDDLVLMYFPTFDRGSGRLVRMRLVPLQIRHFRLNPISSADRDWLLRILDREYGRFGGRVSLRDGLFVVEWD